MNNRITSIDVIRTRDTKTTDKTITETNAATTANATISNATTSNVTTTNATTANATPSNATTANATTANATIPNATTANATNATNTTNASSGIPMTPNTTTINTSIVENKTMATGSNNSDDESSDDIPMVIDNEYEFRLPVANAADVNEAARSSSDVAAEAKNLHQSLVCGICMDKFYHPVTLICQHTFCKSCLVQAKERKCPICQLRFVIPQEYNRIIENAVKVFFNEEWLERDEEARKERLKKDIRSTVEDELREELFEQVVNGQLEEFEDLRVVNNNQHNHDHNHNHNHMHMGNALPAPNAQQNRQQNIRPRNGQPGGVHPPNNRQPGDQPNNQQPNNQQRYDAAAQLLERNRTYQTATLVEWLINIANIKSYSDIGTYLVIAYSMLKIKLGIFICMALMPVMSMVPGLLTCLLYTS